jgi:hypothetical protein
VETLAGALDISKLKTHIELRTPNTCMTTHTDEHCMS